MDSVMYEFIFAGVAILLVLAIALSMRIQRIRLMKMGMLMKHDLSRVERSVDDFRKMMPDLVDREKLALEKASIQREINALQNKFSQDEKRFVKLGREMESDKKEDKRMTKNIEKLQKMLDKLKAKLTPKRKPKAVKRKAKPVKKKK